MVRQSPVAPMTRTRRTAPSPAGVERAATGDQPADAHASHPGGPVHTELGPIIRSKIQAPVLRESTLSRKRLLDRLTEATRLRMTLLTAEAGYGKTTLLADFATRSGIRTIWYRLDPADADIVTWTNHIIAAMREVEPGFGQATLDLMSHLPAGGPPRSAFVSSVIGELGRLEPVPTVLVLDDFHAVDTSDEANEFVVRLTRDAPPWLCLVVSARRRPHFEIGRLTAAGEVAELSTDDLRFSRDETVRLFAEAYATPLDDDVLRDLDGKLHGWAASLQLFHGSIRGRPMSEVRALARAVSGATRPIYEFLAEEVLANLSVEIEHLLVRCSLLERISGGPVVALFGDAEPPPSLQAARGWIEEADRLMLLSRSSESSDARQLHPLLRDFLVKMLEQRETPQAIREMHLRVARAVEDADPLTAARHYVEAGDDEAAMRCLGASVMLTMGSGQWGVAADLIERIKGVPADPAVAAIRARRLIEDGDLEGAAGLLDGVDVSESPPDVRAVFRHARLGLCWRTGDSDRMFSTLTEIQADAQTPQILRDISQVFIEASSLVSEPVPLPALARRLRSMAVAQKAVGHSFYAAVSLHNAAVASMMAGQYAAAVRDGDAALAAFRLVPFYASEQLSTHAVMSLCYLELGNRHAATSHVREALASAREFADVPAELSFAAHITGDRDMASELLLRARLLESNGNSDMMGSALIQAAAAIGELDTDPNSAVARLREPIDSPLDFGYSISRRALLAEALLAADRNGEAEEVINAATDAAQSRRAGRVSVRLHLARAIAEEDEGGLRAAVSEAAGNGELALLELAPLLVRSFDYLSDVPAEVKHSIAVYPLRWLPLVRRLLAGGGTRAGHTAAAILDDYGAIEDVGLLRAYAKTYVRRGPARALGRKLARRVSPALQVRDLGRVELVIGERSVRITEMRRKPASVLLYLISRPGLAANREQVIDALWPDSDPSGAINNLNQSLYFLRREVDPWFEDDVSVDYISFQGDLVWLDMDLVQSDSVAFLAAVQARPQRDVRDATALVLGYRAPFAPEFEYDEWAISWRSRVHASFLDLANNVIERHVETSDYSTARQVAAHVLHVDSEASDVERRLIWLYGKSGLASAAKSQYAHLSAAERADGLEPPSLERLLRGPLPTHD